MRLTGVMLIVAVSLLPACSDDSSGPSGCTPSLTQICMTSSSFNPSALTVDAGTTVTWLNGSGIPHTVTSDPSATESFDSGNLSGSGTFSLQFNTAGSYPYNCEIHSGMTGTLTVN